MIPIPLTQLPSKTRPLSNELPYLSLISFCIKIILRIATFIKISIYPIEEFSFLFLKKTKTLNRGKKSYYDNWQQ